MLRWMKLLAASTVVALVAACGGDDDDDSPGNIAQVATEAGFTALVAAATKADLVTALTDPDADLTVFAPTDEAFGKLATALGFDSATAMVEALPAETLAKILTYHAVAGKTSAADLVALGKTTLDTAYEFEGTAATIDVDPTSGVKGADGLLSQASVTQADVKASNGIIHVIDKVLVPPGVLTIAQMGVLNPAFSSLVEAVGAASLGDALSGTDKLTVFAPTDDAFAALLMELSLTKDQLLALPSLSSVLLYHVVAGDVRAADVIALPKPANVQTLLAVGEVAQTFTVDADLGITDQNARTAGLVATDVIASNGVIHVIDKVLLPTL